jgi:hypothetical protein
MKLLGDLPIQTLLLLSGALFPAALAGPPIAVGSAQTPPAVNPAQAPKPAQPAPSVDPFPPMIKKHDDNKYFHEPGMGDRLSHYDERYFKGEVAYEQHRVNLQLLIRSYLTVFKSLGIETFLAHGTLLGWWWNGKIMPWDYDLDVQVSNETMAYMAANFNRTRHEYEYVDEKTGAKGHKTFLLDVNPHSLDPDRGDGQNVIDARWIDMENGMFVDITNLAERDKQKNPGLWSCKNYHRYRTRDLYPMRETEYEGVPALVPYSFEKILVEEYGPKSLVMTEWKDHAWKPELKEWVQIPQAVLNGSVPREQAGF